MLLGKDSRKRWSTMDVLLATAFQILEAERCPQCGMYVWMCHSDDRDMQFEVVEDSCEATRMVANRSKQLGDKLTEKPWVRLKPQPNSEHMRQAGRDFADLRNPYFEEEAKRLGAASDS